MSSYYVNASTSLIQAEVSSIVYLSSLYSPGTLITIRDYQGKARSDSTIVLSTTKDISFYDGSSTFSINQPFGFLTVTPRTSTTWNLVNSFAFQASAEASVDQITAKVANISTLYTDLISTKQILTSSIGVNVANPQYAIDVAGIVNASDFYKNGQPFVASGDIPVIRTSTISINNETREETVVTSTLLTFSGTTPYKSIDYGESWTQLSNVSLPIDANVMNPVYNPDEQSWYVFYRDGSFQLQAYQSYDLLNWTNCNLNISFGPRVPLSIDLINSNYFVTFDANSASNPYSISSDFITIEQLPLVKSIGGSYTTSIKFFESQNLYVATTAVDLNSPDSNYSVESIQFSSDLSNWYRVSTIGSSYSTGTTFQMVDIEFGNGVYVACGRTIEGSTYGSLLYKDSNISSIEGFSNSDLNSNIQPLSLAFNGNVFVVLTTSGSTGNIYYSGNGSNWSDTSQVINTPAGYSWEYTKVKWNGVNFVITNVIDSTSYYSPDGINWTAASNVSTFTDYTIGITSTAQTLANLQLGQTKIYTIDPILLDSNINQLIFYSTMLKINNSIYISNTGEVGINTSTMTSIFNINGTLTTSTIDLIDSNNRITASSGTLFINNDPLLTSTALGNYSVVISTTSTFIVTNTLSVINPGLSGTLLTSSIGVQCNSPRYEVDVSGTLFSYNLYTNSLSTNTIYANQIGVNTYSPQADVDINGSLYASTARFSSLGVNTNTPSYTLDINGSLNTSSFFINGSLFSTSMPLLSSINVSTLTVFGPDGSNLFIPSTFFDKPLNTTILNTSTLRFYKPSGTASAYEPLTVNSFLSVNNRNTSNIWVALGTEGGAANSVRTSFDGINWTQTLTSIGTDNYGQAVAYNGRQFLVGFVRGNGTTNFYSSSNGTTWSSNILTGNIPNSAVDSLIWTGTYWVVGGTDSGSNSFPNRTIARSLDGSNWSYATSGGLASSSRGLAFNGYRMVNVGYSSSANGTIKYSDDQANTWTNISANGFSAGGQGVAWNGFMWVAVGADTTQNNTIKYSYNGITWFNIPSNGFVASGVFGGFTVAWNGTMWVAGGFDSTNNTLKYSYDGINWSNGTGVFTGASAQNVAWNGSLWVANGSGGQIKYSLNGINWSNGTGAFAGVGPGLAFSSNVFPDLQVENLSIFGKNLFNTVYSTNSIHLQTSSILINNAVRVSQPQLTAQTLNNPTVDIIGPTRIQSLFTQSTLGVNIANPAGVLDIALPSTAGVFSNYPIVRGNVSSETAVSTLLNTVNTWCSLLPIPQSNSASMVLYYRGGTAGNSNYKATITGNTFFTGQHANLSVDSRLKVTNLSSCVGLIVSSADQGYYSILPNGTMVEGKDAIWITEALPKIKLADKDCDKAVWGVITNHMNENYTINGQRDLDYQSLFASPLQGRLRVNGIGEGAIWVTNINGNLANGDYICSSVIPGYGRKQDDDVVHNYTVAKATMSCTFNLNQSSYVCEEFQFNGQTYRRAYIGCSYHCS